MISIPGYKKKNNLVENFNNDMNEAIKDNLDNYDIVLVSKLNTLRDSLSGDKINVQSVRQQIKDISAYDQSQNFSYLNNLLHPEKSRGCKIPSQVPVPSCAFQLHNCVTVSTNGSGNLGIWFNPFFLANESVIGSTIAGMGSGSSTNYVHKFLTTLWINNHASLTGNADEAHWTPVNINQVIPSVYDQYRLVSASMVVKYIGRLDAAQGVIGGAIVYDDIDNVGGMITTGSAYDPTAAGETTECSALAKYGNFDLAMDSFYHKSAVCLEGLRELYFPVDNSYEEYCKCVDDGDVNGETVNGNQYLYLNRGVSRNSFNWMFYALGCPPNANCFKIDIYCNFETIPKAKYLNYMPISINPYSISTEEKKRLILAVQNNPILKGEEEGGDGVLVPSLFMRMMKKFGGGGVPGLDKLKTWGLINSVPGLKSGLALAGNMIAANMDVE